MLNLLFFLKRAIFWWHFVWWEFCSVLHRWQEGATAGSAFSFGLCGWHTGGAHSIKGLSGNDQILFLRALYSHCQLCTVSSVSGCVSNWATSHCALHDILPRMMVFDITRKWVVRRVVSTLAFMSTLSGLLLGIMFKGNYEETQFSLYE